jgi:multidrug efflux pump subunit AcrA (membrane-fusion protein)
MAQDSQANPKPIGVGTGIDCSCPQCSGMSAPPSKKTLKLFTEQPARMEAFEKTTIQSKIPGYIESVRCDIGDKVTQGQTLIRIRAPEYRDEYEQKLAIVGQTNAEIQQTR